MIGLILGPAAEQHLRRALSISQGDWTVLLTRPLSAALLVISRDLLLGTASTVFPPVARPDEHCFATVRFPIESNA